MLSARATQLEREAAIARADLQVNIVRAYEEHLTLASQPYAVHMRCVASPAEASNSILLYGSLVSES